MRGRNRQISDNNLRRVKFERILITNPGDESNDLNANLGDDDSAYPLSNTGENLVDIA